MVITSNGLGTTASLFRNAMIWANKDCVLNYLFAVIAQNHQPKVGQYKSWPVSRLLVVGSRDFPKNFTTIKENNVYVVYKPFKSNSALQTRPTFM